MAGRSRVALGTVLLALAARPGGGPCRARRERAGQRVEELAPGEHALGAGDGLQVGARFRVRGRVRQPPAQPPQETARLTFTLRKSAGERHPLHPAAHGQAAAAAARHGAPTSTCASRCPTSCG